MNRRLNRLACGLSAVVLAFGAVGCGSKDSDAPQPETVIVPDLSGSSDTLRPAMEAEVLVALRAAAAVDGRVVVVGVTGDSEGDPFGEVVVDFRADRPPGLPDNELMNSQFRTQHVDDGLALYRSWVKKHRDRRGSDYAGGLRRAANVLDGHDGPKQLVVVGDGYSNGRLRTGRRGDTPDSCERAGRAAVESGQLPLLTGVPVRWVGGGHTDKPREAGAQTNLRGCWEEVLHAGGAVTEPGWWQPATFR